MIEDADKNEIMSNKILQELTELIFKQIKNYFIILHNYCLKNTVPRFTLLTNLILIKF